MDVLTARPPVHTHACTENRVALVFLTSCFVQLEPSLKSGPFHVSEELIPGLGQRNPIAVAWQRVSAIQSTLEEDVDEESTSVWELREAPGQSMIALDQLAIKQAMGPSPVRIAIKVFDELPARLPWVVLYDGIRRALLRLFSRVGDDDGTISIATIEMFLSDLSFLLHACHAEGR
jgi:hypothetical protein